MDHLSVRLMKLMGPHVEIPPQINLAAASIQASGAGIQTRGNQARLNEIIAQQRNRERGLAPESAAAAHPQDDDMLELDRELLENQAPWIEIHDKATGADGEASPRPESDGADELRHAGDPGVPDLAVESLVHDPRPEPYGGPRDESLCSPEALATAQQRRRERLAEERTEVEAYLPDETLLEQGAVRFHKSIYVANLILRKVGCNIENMKALIRQRLDKYKKVDDELGRRGAGERLKTYDVLDKPFRHQRLLRKLCDIVSSAPAVAKADAAVARQPNDASLMLDIQLEMEGRPRTSHQSYAEIRLFSKLSTTVWDDAVLVPWEALQTFFKFFGHAFDPIEFLKRGRFSKAEAFLFYSHIGDCLLLDPVHGAELLFDLSALTDIRHKHNLIYLQLGKHDYVKAEADLAFYYPDVLAKTGFDPGDHDYATFPFMQELAAIRRHVDQERSRQLFSRSEQQSSVVGPLIGEPAEDFPQGEKPQLLVDDETREFLADPNNLHNLTLRTYPSQQTVFLGKLSLRHEATRAAGRQRGKECTATTERRDPGFREGVETSMIMAKYKSMVVSSAPRGGVQKSAAKILLEPVDQASGADLFNVKIEYFVHGVWPLLEIKAWYCLSGEVLHCRVTNQRQIKAMIRMCGQDQQSMVLSQLQSLICIAEGVHGRRLYLNFSCLREKLARGQQDLYSQVIFSEQSLIKRIGHQNVTQFKGILNLEHEAKGPQMRVLAVVKQLEIETEHLRHHGEEIMKIVYGNKHLTYEQLSEARERLICQSLAEDPGQKMKEHRQLFMWKVALFKMRYCETYEAILTQGDLEDYYETEVFQFFKSNPEVAQPSVFDLLKEYLKNMYTLRTQVGTTLGWNLPQFKKPLDKNGMPVELSPDQVYRLKELRVYEHLRRLQEAAEMRSNEPANLVPVSLDQMRHRRAQKRLPGLGLRARLLIEKVLPIHGVEDLRALKLTSTQHRIVVQRSKIFRTLSAFHFALITVTQHEPMECWIW